MLTSVALCIRCSYHHYIPMGAMERVVVLYSSWVKTGANSLMSVRKRVKSVVLLNVGTPSSSAIIVTMREPVGVVWEEREGMDNNTHTN